MPADPSLSPYARPLSRRWYLALAAVAVVMAGLLGAALTAEHWVPDRRAFKATVAALLIPYQELFLASLPGEDAAEYVVFVSPGARPAEVDAFFAAQRAVRFDREGSLPGTIVVRLTGGRAGLDALKAQPFVKLAVRNQGVYFCH